MSNCNLIAVVSKLPGDDYTIWFDAIPKDDPALAAFTDNKEIEYDHQQDGGIREIIAEADKRIRAQSSQTQEKEQFKILAIITRDNNGNGHIWMPKNLYDTDPCIREFYKKYETSGCSTRGTMEEILKELHDI